MNLGHVLDYSQGFNTTQFRWLESATPGYDMIPVPRGCVHICKLMIVSTKTFKSDPDDGQKWRDWKVIMIKTDLQ